MTALAQPTPPPDPAPIADQVLLDRWLSGDERALGHLIARHRHLVWSACRRRLHAADAEDAVQAVFLVLARKAAQARRARALEAWLLLVARHVVARAREDLARRTRHLTAAPEALMLAQTPPAVDAAWDAVRPHLDDCLDELPEHECAAITLHYLAGRSHAEIASKLDCPVNTVYSHLKRGLERLRGKLRRRGATMSGAGLLSVLATQARAGDRGDLPAALDGDLAALPGRLFASAQAERWAAGAASAIRRTSLLAPVVTAAGLALVTGIVVVVAVGRGATEPEVDPARRNTGVGAAMAIGTTVGPDASPAGFAADEALVATDLDAAPASPVATIDTLLDPQAGTIIRLNDLDRSRQRWAASPYATLSQRDWWSKAWKSWTVMAFGWKGSPTFETLRQAKRIGGSTRRSRRDWRPEQVMMVVQIDRGTELDSWIPGAWPTSPERHGGLLRWTWRAADARTAFPVEASSSASGTDGGTPISGDGTIQRQSEPFFDGDAMSPTAASANRPRERQPDSRFIEPRLPLLKHGFTSSEADAEIITSFNEPGEPDPPTIAGVEPGAYGASSIAHATLTIEPFGMRERYVQALSPETAALLVDIPWPDADAAQFATLPVTTLCAAVIGTSAAVNRRVLDLLEPYGVRRKSDDTVFDAELAKVGLPPLQVILTRIDGGALLWAESGAPFPIGSAIVGIKPDLAEPLLAVLDQKCGMTIDEDGVHRGFIGSVPFAIQHVDGQLIATTHPGGVAAVTGRIGGFTDHPEVASALAELPTRALVKGVSRSGASWDAFIGSLRLMGKLSADHATLEEDVRAAGRHGFLSYRVTHTETVIETGGLVGGLIALVSIPNLLDPLLTIQTGPFTAASPPQGQAARGDEPSPIATPPTIPSPPSGD